MTRTNRRTFLGAAGMLALAGRIAPAAANDRIRVAVIGVRSRGTDLVRLFARNKGAELVAICDVDDAMFAKPLKAAEDLTGTAPRVEKDFRRLLDDRGIDAVAIAAPDHWHALMTVMACQAGKDVYCEKPASHDVVEGRRMVQAARKYDRVVQIGTQRRSAPHVKEAVEFLNAGGVGQVALARAWIHQKRTIDVSGPPKPVPEGVDYALWQGPAPDRPFNPNRFHYNWHWFWNWGTGELGNNGIHGLDVARWGLGVGAPATITSGGGLYHFQGLEVPDTQVVTWDFPDRKASLVWEHRMWSDHGLEGSKFGIAFYGDQGTLVVDEKRWRVEDAGKKPDAKAGGEAGTDIQAAHVANFLDCVRSRQKPNADVETGHLSTRLCHLGNIAHRTGRRLHFHAASEDFGDDAEANALLRREYSDRFRMPEEV